MANKTTVQKYKDKIVQIDEGVARDDYTNHMYSHFGFYDYSPDEWAKTSYSKNTASIPYGFKLPESKGLR